MSDSRYFLVSYKLYNDMYEQHGDVTFEDISGKHFKRSEIRDYVISLKNNRDLYNNDDFIILNIFEFKSKEDYEEFKK